MRAKLLSSFENFHILLIPKNKKNNEEQFKAKNNKSETSSPRRGRDN
jgi:hypothetical protein